MSVGWVWAKQLRRNFSPGIYPFTNRVRPRNVSEKGVCLQGVLISLLLLWFVCRPCVDPGEPALASTLASIFIHSYSWIVVFVAVPLNPKVEHFASILLQCRNG